MANLDIKNPGPDAAQLANAIAAPGIDLDLTGTVDNTAALNDYAAYCANNGFDMVLPRGGIIGIGEKLVVPDGVGIVPNGCIIKAMDGFGGGVLMPVLQLGKTSPFSRYRSATGIIGLKIDLNEQDYAMGIDGQYVYATTIKGQIWKGVKRAVQLLAGYQQNIDLEIFGSCPHSRMGGTKRVDADAVGIFIDSTDSFFHLNVQHYHYGQEDRGGNNVFLNCHPWSSYWATDNPMYIPFIMGGGNARYIGCVADSPRMINNASGQVPSPSNGGIAFYEPTDAAGNNSMIGCSVEVSSSGDTQPIDGSIRSVYVSKDGFELPGLQLGGALSKLTASAIEFQNTNAARRALIGGSGNLRSYLSQPNYDPNTYASATTTLQIGGSGTGISYASQTGSMKQNGSTVSLRLKLILSSKGALTGALTITQLPKAAQQFDQQYLEVVLRNSNVAVPVVGRMNANSNVLVLEERVSGTQLTHAALNDNTEIHVFGTYFAGYEDR